MGGFTLHKGGKPARVLDAKELEELSESGRIEWPTITEEIIDRSKGNYLSKTIVLLQTTWFIIRCIARGAYGLTVTELEVATLAFSALTGVIYFLWWDKPLDVRCSIPVHFLKHCLGKIGDDVKEEDIGSQFNSPPEVEDQEIQGDEKVVNLISLSSTPIQVDISTPDPGPTNPGSLIIPSLEVSNQGMSRDEVVIHPNSHPLTLVQDDTSSLNPALTRMQRFQATLFEHGYMFIVFPLKCFAVAVIDMVSCSTLGDQKLRVPTFYSLPDKLSDARVVTVLAVCVSIVFGAIHCIAWSFHFATLREQWAWRISAILISGVPIFLTFSMSIATGLQMSKVA